MAEKFSHLYSVFVGNLHEDVSENELCQLFMGSGEVVDHVLIKGKDRNKSNFGFVRYATQEEAVKSIKDFNGWSFKSQRIIVDIASNSGQKLNFAQAARSDETAKSSLNNPPPSLWSTSSHDSVLNYNRVKEACSWVTDEFFATTHGGICNTEHIINDLDKKETATLLPIPLMKPTGTTSYRLVIKSLNDWESSLDIPPDQSPSASVQNHYNIILEVLQKYLKPWSALDNSPVGRSGELNSPVGQSGVDNSIVLPGDNNSPVGQAEDINNSPVGQSGDDNSTVPLGDKTSPVGQAEDINISPVGHSGEFNSLVGQSGDSNSPMGQSGDNNTPVGQSGDNNSPAGQWRDNNSPVGQLGDNNSPVGQSRDNNSPVGQSGDNNSPVGQSGDNNSPVGQSRDNNSPIGQSGDNNSPVGQSGDNNSPVPQSGYINNAPVGQSGYINNAPVGQLEDHHSPVNESGDSVSPAHLSVDINDSPVTVNYIKKLSECQSPEETRPTTWPATDQSPEETRPTTWPATDQSPEETRPTAWPATDQSPEETRPTAWPATDQSPEETRPTAWPATDQSPEETRPTAWPATDQSPEETRPMTWLATDQSPEETRPMTWPATDPKMPKLISQDNSNNIMVLMKQRFLLATNSVHSSRPTSSPHMSCPAQFPAPPPPQLPTSSLCRSSVLVQSKKADGQSSKKADGQNFKKADGQNSKKADGQNLKKADGQNSKKADGQNFKKADGQNSKKADGHCANILLTGLSCKDLLDSRSSMTDRKRTPAHVTKDCKTLRSTAAVNVHFVAEERDQSGWTFDKQELCTNMDQWATMSFDEHCFQ